MIDFLLGVVAGSFIMLVLLQLTTRKTINFAGYVNKSEDPKRFWIFTSIYFAGFLGATVFMMVYDKL